MWRHHTTSCLPYTDHRAARRRILSASVTRNALTGTTSLDKGQQSSRECCNITEYLHLKKMSAYMVDNIHMYSIARDVIPTIAIIPKRKCCLGIPCTLWPYVTTQTSKSAITLLNGQARVSFWSWPILNKGHMGTYFHTMFREYSISTLYIRTTRFINLGHAC